MKDLPSKEHYCYKFHTLLIKNTAFYKKILISPLLWFFKNLKGSHYILQIRHIKFQKTFFVTWFFIAKMQNICNLIGWNSVHISDVLNCYRENDTNGMWNAWKLGGIIFEFKHFLYFRLPLFFSLSDNALDVDPR